MYVAESGLIGKVLLFAFITETKPPRKKNLEYLSFKLEHDLSFSKVLHSLVLRIGIVRNLTFSSSLLCVPLIVFKLSCMRSVWPLRSAFPPLKETTVPIFHVRPCRPGAWPPCWTHVVLNTYQLPLGRWAQSICSFLSYLRSICFLSCWLSLQAWHFYLCKTVVPSPTWQSRAHTSSMCHHPDISNQNYLREKTKRTFVWVVKQAS